jgi:hypothetical protein
MADAATFGSSYVGSSRSAAARSFASDSGVAIPSGSRQRAAGLPLLLLRPLPVLLEVRARLALPLALDVSAHPIL